MSTDCSSPCTRRCRLALPYCEFRKACAFGDRKYSGYGAALFVLDGGDVVRQRVDLAADLELVGSLAEHRQHDAADLLGQR